MEKFLFSVPVRRRYLILAVSRNYSARLLASIQRNTLRRWSHPLERALILASPNDLSVSVVCPVPAKTTTSSLSSHFPVIIVVKNDLPTMWPCFAWGRTTTASKRWRGNFEARRGSDRSKTKQSANGKFLLVLGVGHLCCRAGHNWNRNRAKGRTLLGRTTFASDKYITAMQKAAPCVISVR